MGIAEYAELGFGTFAKTPIQIGTGTNWERIACGEMHVIATQKDGTLWAWGYNENGQLGDGTKINKDSPTRIGTATNWKSVSAARNQSFAIQTDGSLWSWGDNTRGQLGYYENIIIPKKIDVYGVPGWKAVTAGQQHTIAIQTNGTLWAWGSNGYGQRGDGTTSSGGMAYMPTQIGYATWKNVAAGETHTVAVRDDGTLWAWGSNYYGQLGDDGTTTNQLIPEKIDAATNWKEVTVGFGSTFAVKTDGTLWAWGNNEYGQLGDGTTTNQLIPKRIGTETIWKSISEGYAHTAALKSDGTLWAWGYNGGGQFGDGTTTNKHNPTQITQSFCVGTMTIPVTPKTIPTFTTIAPICSGNNFVLPTTSNNGITGTWSPAINSTATTIYTFTPDANQCADLAMLTVAITAGLDHVTTATACDSYTWANNNQVYTTSGIYTGTTTNCVTEKLDLTITPNSDNIIQVAACGSYTWNNKTYTQSGIYTGTTNNCVTQKLDLTITPNSDNVTPVSACGSYTWNNQNYTQSGIYTGTTNNCVTEKLDLTITAIPTNILTTVNQNNGVLTADQIGIGYQWLNCNGTEIIGETNQFFTPTISGQYAVRLIVACSAPVISNCVTVTSLKTDDFEAWSSIKIYPNPSTGIFYLQTSSDKQLEVYNNLGQLLVTKKINSGTNKIDISDKADGVYFVKIIENGNTSNFKVIKKP